MISILQILKEIYLTKFNIDSKITISSILKLNLIKEKLV